MLTLSLRSIIVRIVCLALAAAGFGALIRFVAKTAIGDSLMTFVRRSPTLSTQAQIEGADKAVGYSPHDPLIRWGRGGVYLNAAAPEENAGLLDRAVDELRQATVLGPNDH